MSGHTEITRNRAAAFRLVYVQLVITVVIALLSYVVSGLVIAYSVLLGSAVHILPNLYFVRSAFKRAEGETPQLILSRFYIAEAQKILVTIAMFTICFALVKPLHAVAFFAAYILIMIVNLAGLAISKKIN
ncbi:MAG: ATP synthase protein I [Gammaproteobacteria bacterium]